MRRKIRILGAGPAGLSCAISLARAGLKVEVFEKEKDCGLRFSGDLQGLENWTQDIDILDDLKSMNIQINFSAQPFKKIKAYDPKLKCTELSSITPGLYVVQRGKMKGTLDQGLKTQARKLGVKIIFKASSSDVDIVATGPSCADAVIKGITFQTKMQEQGMIFLDDNIAPKGYAYFLISKGRGCLVTVIGRHFHREQEYFDKMMQKVKGVFDLKATEIKEFGGYGNFFLERKYVYDNRIHIGEAAGMQDFLAGFGMRYAITSGYLAAQSIIQKKDFEKLIRERFEKQLETSIPEFSVNFLTTIFLRGEQSKSIYMCCV